MRIPLGMIYVQIISVKKIIVIFQESAREEAIMHKNNKVYTLESIPSGESLANFIKDMSQDKDDSFFICNLSDVIDKYETWTKLMPRIVPYYALKANNYPPMAKALLDLGCGFDCATQNELKYVLELGAAPEKIIFANTIKYPSHILYAKNNGIQKMTFDNVAELHKIKSIYPEASLVLRIRCDCVTARYKFGVKFGCDPDEAIDLLKVAKELNLNVMGLSFHVGTEIKQPAIYDTALAKCKQVFDAAKSMGIDINLIDIGGGFDGAIGSSLQPIADVVNSALNSYFPDKMLNIISEPGHYFVCSAFMLITKVFGMKSEKLSNEMKYHYYLNDSLYKNFGLVKIDKPKPLKDNKTEKLYKSTIWGHSCNPADFLLRDIDFPLLEIGDILIWENFGAYSFCLHSSFHLFESSEIFLITDPRHKIFWKQDLEVKYIKNMENV